MLHEIDEGPASFISSLYWLRDGRLAVGISGKYNQVKIYNISNNNKKFDFTCEKQFVTRTEEVRAIAQLSDGRIAIGKQNYYIMFMFFPFPLSPSLFDVVSFHVMFADV